jgi:hypothetical protein
VAVGDYITWTEGFTGDAQGEELKRLFAELIDRIDKAADLDDDERILAKEKTEAVANGLANPGEPGRLRLALRDAKGFLAGPADWIWRGINKILTSDAAQKVISTITEAGAQAAIKSFTGP